MREYILFGKLLRQYIRDINAALDDIRPYIDPADRCVTASGKESYHCLTRLILVLVEMQRLSGELCDGQPIGRDNTDDHYDTRPVMLGRE